MSSTRSTASQDGTKPHTASSLEVDIARLTRLLSEDLVDDANTEADVEELLRRIEAAEGLADGVEEQLDGIIGNLDNLLHDLEERASRGTGTETGIEGEIEGSNAAQK